MMKKKTSTLYIIFSVILMAFILMPAKAQRKNFILDEEKSRWMLSLVPLPLIQGGFRIDFDIPLNDHLWLQLAPRYNGLKNRLEGFALEGNLRYYDPVIKGLYYSAGLMFDKNHVSDSLSFKKEEMMTYYDIQSWRIGGQLYIGYLFKAFPKTCIDIFGGFGFRYATLRPTDPAFPISEVSLKRVGLSSPIYDGLTFILGIRIALVL